MIKFTIDGIISAYGQDLGDRWNGWRTPSFPRDQWESLLKQMREIDNWDHTYSEFNGRITADICEECESCSMDCDNRESYPIESDGSCALGAWAWIWSEIPALTIQDLTRENFETFRNTFAELAGWWFHGTIQEYFAYVAQDFNSVEELNEYWAYQAKVLES